MFLYNVTVGIDKDLEAEWVQWMKDQYIPVVMATGMFADWKMYKVLHDQEDGSVSYSVQYFAASIERVVQFVEQVEPELNRAHQQRYKDRHVAFRTLLEEV
ncbi:DUF4286 family protein [Dawidia soli]|uniref:DUF4286 family protein n=1 Tax=Dawidia soli TaxID=2782352 RepID=A0AAP2DGB2_9BACT|nr:DUF4286 family protein [Dawidia soli]MBT1688827.1 DUF4286 family protein [Dawidia soli]